MKVATENIAAENLAPTIRQLPPGVVNKIAAGEVIERPASIIKELMENSIDAGANRIDVHIAKGGIESIQVTDNGCGIRGDQLELAVASHATSKIVDADDLFDVHTLGFRGEALASIAAVSQFTLRSKTHDADSGFEMQITGGVTNEIKPCGTPNGTTVIVEELFYNTPVRRKFLRTTQTEMSHITEAFTRIALANAHVHMTLIHNDKTVHDLPSCENWKNRIADFFGNEISDSLIAVESEESGIRLGGFVVDPVHSRAHNRMQYLFLNGRHIKDRSLQHALAEAYRGLLLHGRHPIAFLKLDMPADRVDVNVHPCKLEVRFQDGGKLYSQLLGTIRNRFLTTDLTARQAISQPPETNLPPTRSPYTQDDLPLQSTQRTTDWTAAPATPQFDRSHSGDKFSEPFPSQSPKQPVDIPNDGQQWHEQVHSDFGSEGGLISSPIDQGAVSDQNNRALQIHNRYLVTQSDEGIVVIDQHALHERIIYEQLRQKVLDGKLESQRLLVPEPLNLAPAECSAVIEAKEELSTIGIEIEPFGGDTVLVQAYPAMLANHNPGEMLRNVIEVLLSADRKVEQRDVVDELLHMISCKAAVKAGDKLSPEEITALLEHRELCQDSHHCPHGRPTSLVFSREELDKRFKRI